MKVNEDEQLIHKLNMKTLSFAEQLAKQMTKVASLFQNVINDCPTLDNKINCSECTHECKLRMQPEQSKEDILLEYPPAVIYY